MYSMYSTVQYRVRERMEYGFWILRQGIPDEYAKEYQSYRFRRQRQGYLAKDLFWQGKNPIGIILLQSIRHFVNSLISTSAVNYSFTLHAILQGCMTLDQRIFPSPVC